MRARRPWPPWFLPVTADEGVLRGRAVVRAVIVALAAALVLDLVATALESTTASSTVGPAPSTVALTVRGFDDGLDRTALADLVPGERQEHVVLLTNPLPGPVTDLTAHIEAVGDASLIVDGSGRTETRALTLGIDRCPTAGTTVGMCTGPWRELLPSAPLGGLIAGPVALDLTVPAGATLPLRIRIRLPEQSGDTTNGVLPSDGIQGAAIDVIIGFDAVPVTAGRTPADR